MHYRMVKDLDYDVLDVDTSNGMLYSADVLLETSKEQESVEITRRGSKGDDIIYHLEPSGFDETRSEDIFVRQETAEIVGEGRIILDQELDDLIEDVLTKYADLDRSEDYDYTDGDLTNPLM